MNMHRFQTWKSKSTLVLTFCMFVVLSVLCFTIIHYVPEKRLIECQEKVANYEKRDSIALVKLDSIDTHIEQLKRAVEKVELMDSLRCARVREVVSRYTAKEAYSKDLRREVNEALGAKECTRAERTEK